MRPAFRLAIGFAALLGVFAVSTAQDGRRHDGERGRGFSEGASQDLKDLDLPYLLKRAVEVGPRLRYAGTRVIEFKRGSQRNSHKEFVVKDGSKIRITFPSDSDFAGQVIIENGDAREHYFPSRNEIEVLASRREETLTRMVTLMSRGRKGGDKPKFDVGDSETVAGRRCTPVAICDPRGNALVRFWIDQRTAMVLKRELYDPAGGVVGSQEFQSIDYRPRIRQDDFQLPMRISGATRLSQEMIARRLMKEKGMMEVFLPSDGDYKLEGSRAFGNSEKPTLMLFYRGPEGPLTLHQVDGEVDESKLRRNVPDDLNVYTWKTRGRTFALIGKLGVDDLKRLAAKIRF